ncbi:hypothetical protein E4U55_005418 [Claviceps digitariae]|nr:hypothetical protein E4U55_005418 [Claviceps digitariae]
MASNPHDVTILDTLRHIQQSQTQLLASVEALTERVNAQESVIAPQAPAVVDLPDFDASCALSTSEVMQENSKESKTAAVSGVHTPSSRSNLASRIVLTGGSYAIYYALAVASKELNIDHRPDFTNTEPAAQIGPFPPWGDSRKIVAMDPWGHLTPWIFRDMMKQEQDGKVCLNDLGELAVTKFAVEPVWYLPGVAERFGIDEGTLRRSLFEHTGGSFPELITRGDIKVFLPPIGGLTVYCFGDPEKMSDEHVRLSLRIHDEYLVYNARKRGEDRASDYFLRTENIAGVKDMRFQALMPDILHWLGIKKIDRMLSMSNMKHDAIVGQGCVIQTFPWKHKLTIGQSIPILERVELPGDLIPADSRVEIDAKITAGYFTAGTRLTAEELQSVQGRMWEEPREGP